MAQKKIGKQTLQFGSAPVIISKASVVGPKEGQGPLGSYFDLALEDNLDKQKSWEMSEQKIMQHSIELALEKAGLVPDDLDVYLAGDLLNQIISSNYTARFLSTSFLGLYGACSTLVEGLAVGALFLDGEYADTVGVSACSHHDTAERQLRFPTELGVQRPPSAQWTVTGAGSYILTKAGSLLKIPQVTIGKIVDKGVSDTNDMGTAMAAAALDTIKVHLQDTGNKMEDYDLIITGDLGLLGLNVLKELLKHENMPTDNVTDCGIMIYAPDQDTHSGGSGCGCSAVVLCYLLDQMLKNKYRKIFLVGTGALLSPTSIFQGESIPCIAHGAVIEK